MSTRIGYRLKSVVVGLALVSGCASFRAGDLPPIAQWPPAAGPTRSSISVVVSGEAIVNDQEQEVNARFLEIWRERTLKAYHDSGLFSQVTSGLGDSDLRAEVNILDRGEGSMALAFLTGLTMYLVPSKATDELIVSTTYKDRHGNSLGTFEKSETVTMWQQLFMVFAMPVKFPGSVARETLYDLSRATITEARERKVL